MSHVEFDSARFRKVLGSYPTGVSIITAFGEGRRPVGMVVGTFTSVSLAPPLVGFLPEKSSSTWPAIEAAGKFCVNVLGSDQQAVCRQFAVKGADKFAGIDYAASAQDLPIIGNSIATIECSLYSVIDAGDHWIVLGRVLALDVNRDEDPLLFHRGQYGGFKPAQEL